MSASDSSSVKAAGASWRKPAAAAAIVLAVAGVGGWFLSRPVAAPDVTFISISGDKMSSKAMLGKVVMVNFWATSCTTCVKEMPQMVDTYNKFKGQGLMFVAVAMRGDPPNYVLNYAETRHLPFQVVLDAGGDLAQSFGNVAMTPTTFVINKDGKIIKRYVGEPSFAELHQLLQSALAG